MFGNPGELLAPRRLSVFKLKGPTVKYRQAQAGRSFGRRR